ncbi:MAG: hypothetical protein DRQ59_07400 [Gammaproteobacteria bacterium]|nr:MAG: hypothetical protein DRQ59_07400 [Gammaproteobacteria bacterium]
MTKFSILNSANNLACLCRLLIIIVATALWHSSLEAEDRQQSIQYEITPYLWAASINGSTAISGEPETPIDSDYSFFSLDNLSGVASATFTARGQQWGFLFDFLYVEYQDTIFEGTPFQATPKLNGRILEFAGTYKPASVNDFEIIAGLRRQDIDFELAILNRTPQASVGWTDPFVGVIYTPALTNKLYLGLRGDVGGFGIESDLAVNAEAMLRYQFGDTFSFKFGYRYLKVKFDDSSLIYDISLDGFLFGLGIRF